MPHDIERSRQLGRSEAYRRAEALNREPASPDEQGRPLNRYAVSCSDCAGTGFIEDGPDPRGRVGWCGNCKGLGWYALLRPAALAADVGLGLAGVALIVGALAVSL